MVEKARMPSGTVVRAPARNNVQPTALRCSLSRRSASSRAMPPPSITRVPAMSASSGIVSLVSFMVLLLGPIMAVLEDALHALNIAPYDPVAALPFFSCHSATDRQSCQVSANQIPKPFLADNF